MRKRIQRTNRGDGGTWDLEARVGRALKFMGQACQELTGGNYTGLQHEELKSDWKQTASQLGNKSSPSWVFGST